LALLKMVMHARSGGTLEVMGLLLGKVSLAKFSVQFELQKKAFSFILFLG